ncbi:glycosyl hydrolase [Dipodascopsis uninucleata]
MLYTVFATFAFFAASLAAAKEKYNEIYRPQFHYSPQKNWMNDPNGLLYHKGVYHLFYQYNYDGITWGNMSWDHATSSDLIHWTEKPIAMKAEHDSSGALTEMIYSGSAVSDASRTSGFGTKNKPPLESQSIAYSTDEGITWTQFSGNPVTLTPPEQYADQYENFRDPFVFWHEESSKWVMVASLANLHKLLIYVSKDLKNWENVSEFGPVNAVGGQWECPGLFPLLVDGKKGHEKWVVMIGINPGGPAVPDRLGSATQYVVGTFNGTTFVPDSDNVYVQEPSADSYVFEDWSASTFAAAGWTATGDLVGQGPVDGTVLTLQNADATVGTLSSRSFIVSSQYIMFQFGCCYNPYNATTYNTTEDSETTINLIVNSAVVRTATGVSGGGIVWDSWDVSDLAGKSAHIEIVDTATGGYGHLQVGDIVFSNSSLPPEANWVDHGPDFYAASSYNGLSKYERIAIGWMSDWAYGADIPTYPWRSAMSIPRLFTLGTVNGETRLLQKPVSISSLEPRKPSYHNSWSRISNKNLTLPVSGKALDITIKFKAATSKATGTFGVEVRTNKKSQKSIIGYDFATSSMFVDRSNSGDVSFSSSFPGVYYAPLVPQSGGYVQMRILLDWSSVEVFGGSGESVITAQIFPSDASTDVSLFSVGTFKDISIEVYPVASSWK